MKNSSLTRRSLCVTSALVIAFLGHTAVAQENYPAKPVTLVVPFTPAGSNDVIARVVGQRLSQIWHQPVIVDNKPGAAGSIGTDQVAKASADGYKLLITNNNTMSINPMLLPNTPYAVARDFAQVTQLGTVPVVLVVNSNLKVTTVKELVALAKISPGKLSYASSGSGSPQHLSAELFKSMTGTDIAHIPYKGAAPAITDMLAGQVDLQFGAINSLLPHIRSGKLRALAVGGTRRASLLPNVPTMAEVGLPQYDSEIWLGLAAPTGTPSAVIKRINADVSRVLEESGVKEKLAEQGIEARSSTPQEMTQLVERDTARWASVIKGAGIKAD
ncbi:MULTISPECIES: Bug family tripartite tricarboxylate transporter substrate binding protein [Comamonas]|uniref:Bug family tripartite tricarboxylate transporter substrate binding protein n=1 Tax=Comamonas TaxID=283 RepID=UPI0005BE8DB4|nr:MULTISPECIES: tripartite tricarboxylate transporter substrate binding protein [Comamonas]